VYASRDVTSARWAGSLGVIFAVALTACLFVLDLPGHDDGDQRVNDFYADGSGRLRVAVGAYLAIASGLAFLGFVWLASRRQPGDSATAATVIALGAAVFFAAAGTSQGPTYALSVGAFDEPLAPLTRFDVHQAYGHLLAAYAFAGVSLLVLCRAMGSWPRVVTWSGYAAGLLSLAAILFLPLVALPLWATATGIWLMSRSREPG
jgi:hypothetical protein